MKKNPYGIVYCATNKENGKKYVGATICPLDQRITGHKSYSKKRNSAFMKALKNNPNDFEWVVLAECKSAKELGQKEKDFIKSLNSTDSNFGYNKFAGGYTERQESFKKKFTHKSISLPDPMWKLLSTEAKKMGISVGELIRYIIKEWRKQ